jgi:hypothetical protein
MENNMKDGTSLEEMRQKDGDLLHAIRFADIMVNMLRDFIPENSRRDSREMLIKAALDQGFEMTSKDMRKQYEAWGTGSLITNADGSTTRVAPEDMTR